MGQARARSTKCTHSDTHRRTKLSVWAESGPQDADGASPEVIHNESVQIAVYNAV
jgi:hypothetical protein